MPTERNLFRKWIGRVMSTYRQRTCIALASNNSTLLTEGRNVHNSNLPLENKVCLYGARKDEKAASDEFKEGQTFISQWTRDFFCIRAYLRKMFRLEQIVVCIFAFRAVLAAGQIKVSAWQRFVYSRLSAK